MSYGILKSAITGSAILMLMLGCVILIDAGSVAADSPQSAADVCGNLNLAGGGSAQTACQQGYTAQGAGTPKQSACNSSKYSNTDDLVSCREGWDYAAHVDPAVDCTSGNCDLIAKYINPIINIFSVSFGLIVVISLILGGIQFAASEGDPQKAAQAKSRITNTILALVVYSFFYSFLQFLIPGGLFHH